jgi:hypothetical protein
MKLISSFDFSYLKKLPPRLSIGLKAIEKIALGATRTEAGNALTGLLAAHRPPLLAPQCQRAHGVDRYIPSDLWAAALAAKLSTPLGLALSACLICQALAL